MAFKLPFLNGATKKKRTQMIAVDLGSRTTKAVLLEKRGEILALTRYALLDAPLFDKKMSPELLGEHLKAVAEALGSTTKFITMAVGLDDAVVRQIELPQIPVDEMRQILRVNHKNYLQQDLPNHVFDCYIIPPRLHPGEKDTGIPKLKVLAAAARQQLVADFINAAALAGLTADSLVPGLVGPINTFELALPEIYARETVALVDIGFKHTSVCVLDKGELVLNRLMNIGGDQLTVGLADAMGISYAEAEGIKVGMAPEVETSLQSAISMLTVATAPHLPTASTHGGTGFIMSGSSEPRSRSPAVVSSAAFKAPVTTDKRIKNASIPVYCAARVWLLAKSRSCTLIGDSSVTDTPRNAKLKVARSWLNCLSSCATRGTPDSLCLLELSLTTSTSGASPRTMAASKSAGTTTTGSPSLESRSCCS